MGFVDDIVRRENLKETLGTRKFQAQGDGVERFILFFRSGDVYLWPVIVVEVHEE